VREYVEVFEQMSTLFSRYRGGCLSFDEVLALCDDKPSSPLFRLKERCHALFRDAAGDHPMPVQRAALFDLAVGSLFHEAMKFRENFYQPVVYAPKVRALRGEADAADDELFREFEKILVAAEERLGEAVLETEALLSHTGDQLRVLLAESRSGLIARYLIAQRKRVESFLEDGLNPLLSEMFGSLGDAYSIAAESWLSSAHFRHAIAVLDEARAAAPEGHNQVADEGLRDYAEGMRAFLAGDYPTSLDRLETWLADARPDEATAGGRKGKQARYAALAHSALSRVDHLVHGESASQLAERAGSLSVKLEAFLSATLGADALEKSRD